MEQGTSKRMDSRSKAAGRCHCHYHTLSQSHLKPLNPISSLWKKESSSWSHIWQRLKEQRSHSQTEGSPESNPYRFSFYVQTDLTIDVRDAVGDRLHISDSEFTKDGTTFEIGHAGRLEWVSIDCLVPFSGALWLTFFLFVPHSSVPTPDLSVGRTIDAAKKVKVPSFRKKNKKPARRSSAFKKTDHIVKDGPACRIFGSMEVKKVTGNLHITTLGHGYWSWEHTDHSREFDR